MQTQSTNNTLAMFVNCGTAIGLGVMLLAGCATGADLCPEDGCLPLDASADEVDGEPLPDIDPRGAGVEPELLAAQVTNLLTQYCGGCHSAPSSSGGLDFITDLARLVEEGYVIPGAAADSTLYYRIVSGEMPPTGEGPNEEEITVIRQWINSGAYAPEAPETCDNATLTYEEILDTIGVDLITVDEEDRPFTRYLSLHDLYNRNACEADLEKAREVANKLVNSLSQNFEVARPVVIGPEGLLLRINIQDYNWDADDADAIDLWEEAADANPYALVFDGDIASIVTELTGTSRPVQTLSSFLQVTTRPPLYYQFTAFPNQLDTFFADLGIDLEQAQVDGDAIRAGSTRSEVAFSGRVVERVPISLGRNLWLTYDFDDDVAAKGILSDPINTEHVQHEVMYNLPNGFNAYAITDAAGNRLERSPVDIITDPAQRTQEVIAGISCMSCHSNGLQPFTDQVGPFFLQFPFKLIGDLDQVLDLYVANEEFQSTLNFDNQLLASVHNLAGLPFDGPDGIVLTSLNFETDLTLQDFAAELGLPPDYLGDNIVVLDPTLTSLRDGGRVSRDIIDNLFVDSLCRFPVGGFRISDEICFEPQ